MCLGDGGFLRFFHSYLSLVKWTDVWLENTNGPQLGYVLRVSVGNFEMDPSSVILEDFWLETVRVMCSGHQMEVGLGGH